MLGKNFTYVPTSLALTKQELTLRQGKEPVVFNILGASTMMVDDLIFSDSNAFDVSHVFASGSFDEHMIL